MYYQYQAIPSALGARFLDPQATHLFGCNVGMIPRMLRGEWPDGIPTRCHLPVTDIMGRGMKSLVISLKPKNRRPTEALSLYEVRNVWGVSSTWTRMLLHLRGLVVDGRPHIDDPTDFEVEYPEEHSFIFTFLYVEGGIDSGRVTGKWTGTRPSPTNSLLLWPGDLDYFLSCIQTVCPTIGTPLLDHPVIQTAPHTPLIN